MTWARHAATAMGLALIALTAACGPDTGPPPAAAPPPTPRVINPPPGVSISDRLVEQASAYRGFMSRATAISPGFTSGEDVSQAVRTGAGYEPQQFLRGAVAYAAVAALQEKPFVDAVRATARDASSRRALAIQIMANPAYALGFPGADAAASRAMAALTTDGMALYMAGKAVKQSAYDVQHQDWSKAPVANPVGRLAEAKSLSATPQRGSVEEALRLQAAISGRAPLDISGNGHAPYSPLIARAVSLAALAALGEAGDVSVDAISPTLGDPSTAYCLNMAKLNLYQCLAVARPNYEDIFCLGQHIMLDTGSCIVKGAGGAVPLEVIPRPMAVPPPRRPARPRPRARR